jgi:hypothetical protein
MLFSLRSFRISGQPSDPEILLSSLPAARAIQHCASRRSLGTDRRSTATVFRDGLPGPAARLSGSRRHPRQYACRTPSASGRRRADAVPWRLSRSVIDPVGLAGAELVRNARIRAACRWWVRRSWCAQNSQFGTRARGRRCRLEPLSGRRWGPPRRPRRPPGALQQPGRRGHGRSREP